jgi:hypothetical protein
VERDQGVLGVKAGDGRGTTANRTSGEATFYEDDEPVEKVLAAFNGACLTCDGSGVLVDCHGGSCSHVNDREYPCPACEVAREVGDEPEGGA